MKNWKPLGRRGLALILALIMCLSLTNLTVLAAGAQEAPPKGYETHSTPTVE